MEANTNEENQLDSTFTVNSNITSQLNSTFTVSANTIDLNSTPVNHDNANRELLDMER